MFYTSLLFFLLFLFCSVKTSGQNNGLISQYMFNKLLINPAYAGEDGALSLNLLHKDQWTSVDGAPSTQIVSAHAPFTQNASAGLIVARDRMGNLDQHGLYGSYAYQIKFESGAALSLGLQAGLSMYHIRDRYIPVRDPGDPVFTEEPASATEPNFGAGLFYSNDRLYVGFSSPHLVKGRNGDPISFALQQRSYLLHGGYSFRISDDFTVNPSVLVHLKSHYKPELNLNVNVLIRQVFWAGILYRNFDSIGALSKIHINERFHLGYGYDFNTGPLRSLSSGSHELMLFYTFSYVKGKVKSPRFF